MKDKASVLAIVGIFTMIALFFVVFLSTMSAFQATKTEGCYWANGTIHNCTESQNNFVALNQSMQQTARVLTYVGYENYLIVGVGLIAVVGFLVVAVRS